MLDFNVFTMNSKAFPATAPLVARLGDHVKIRLANLSANDHNPFLLHGYKFRVTETDGGQIPTWAQQV
jgi:FtsP/CotA-like multicopper oxidase with cupredoxin domain